MQLADFHPLGPAEQRLVDWLRAGNRGACEISEGVPPADTPEVRLRASLIRHLALGGCDACRAPGVWPDAYEHSAKVLREMGHAADARAILIAKDHRQRRAARERVAMADANFGAPRAALMALRDTILNLTIRYGRQPLLAFAWLAGFWALGTWVFAQAAATGQIKPNLPQMQVHPAWVECRAGGARRGAEATQVACFLAQPEGASYPTFNALLHAADTLFPVVALEVQSYWIPDDRQPFGGWARWYLWFHIAMGWALTLLAVAGFSGLIKTDSR